jgi:putative spermidine/putrescine transport system permease protein
MKMAATASRPSTATGSAASAASAAGSANGKKGDCDAASSIAQTTLARRRQSGSGAAVPRPVLLAPLIGLLLRGVLEPTPGLGNYEQLFANSAYARVLLNTFSVAGLVTVFSLLLGFPLAWAITLVPRGWGRWILNIVLLSMWTSLLARTYSWLVLLQASGVINKALMAMGIIDQPLEWCTT